MTTIFPRRGRSTFVLVAATVVACGRDATTATETSRTANALSSAAPIAPSAYQVTYLVADTAGFGAARIDRNLVNGWGIAITPTGRIWISSNGPGLSVVYDGSGNQIIPPVTIPARDGSTGGTPSGVVFNATSDFLLGNGNPARFLFASEDGIISGWNSGSAAERVAKSASAKSVYKGLAIAQVGGQNFIYATNFSESRIDVFDSRFKHQNGTPFQGARFVDTGLPAIPSDFGPFGIANIGGQLYVTYAKHLPPDNHDDEAGPGNGYISIFNSDGTFVGRFASNGTLNSPWGVTVAGPSFGEFSNAIIVNNFGDGRINGFSRNGQFLGQLQGADHNPLIVDGIWSVVSPSGVSAALDQNTLYFAAGPNDESHGTFGTIRLAPR